MLSFENLNKKSLAVISQPRYLPALNYLQRINFSNIFVIYDIVQRSSRGYENRNKMMLSSPKWLTIPIESSSRALINETKISDIKWIDDHQNKLEIYYKNSKFFSKEILHHAYKIDNYNYFLCDVLIKLLNNACDILNINPNFVKASQLLKNRESSISGVDLLKETFKNTGSHIYVSGPNGRNYGVKEAFSNEGLKCLFHDYDYPIYNQSYFKFVPYLGYLDAVFNQGIKWTSDKINTKNLFFENE